MTTATEIATWFDGGVRRGATHMLVVCDTFDHDDYPVYCLDDADAIKQHAHYTTASMQRVMEVYDLRMDRATQLAEARANHLPSLPALSGYGELNWQRASQPEVKS